MIALRFIGIDPGPTTGLIRLDYTAASSGQIGTPFGRPRVTVAQCSANVAVDVYRALLGDDDVWTWTQAERYVIGRKSAHAGASGTVTQALLGELGQASADHLDDSGPRTGGWSSMHNASAVKAWATGERLKAAGLWDWTTGMGHARDAARHALFAAVHSGKVPDPLSKRARS